MAWRCSVRTRTCWTPSGWRTGRWRAPCASAWARRTDRTGHAGVPFQLAFLLLNLPGLADPHDVHRETVDLLFFPTGGGKTEAYLGLAAAAMVLRRLRHPGDDGLAGAGVSVIMRYTLRLLTLDQLARAAGLICALEIERTAAGERYGTWPFEIDLWVGKAATPNILGRKGDGRPDSARAKVTGVQAQSGPEPVSDPARELSLVPDALRARVVHAAAGRRWPA